MSENCNDNLKKVFDLNTWNLIKVKSKYQFDCRDCEKDCQYVKCSKEFNEDILLCGTCKRRKHNLKKYGVPETRMLKSVQDKQKETWRNRTDLEKQQYHEKLSKIRRSFSEEKKKQIGSKISKSLLDKTTLEKQVIKEKRRTTCKNLYGDPDFRNQEKARQTKKDKYGDENYNNRSQVRKTSLERYGVEVNSQGFLWKKQMRDIWRNRSKEEVERIYQKVKQTKKDRYGDENYNNREKSRETNLKKYGDPYYTNQEKRKITWNNLSPERKTLIRRKTQKKFTYDNIQFDSSWELAVWIWVRDHNKYIVKEPIQLEYKFQDKIYQYYPDFELEKNNKRILVEIKGDHFFENGLMINPFDRSLDLKAQAKQVCALKHNVIFWTQKDVKFAINYIHYKYGKGYLRSFRNA